jgi:Protein of unknown function (DUF3455)
MRMLMLVASLVVAAGVADTPAYTVTGKGYQVYVCSDQGAWMFQAPEATLYLNGAEVGHHGKGPTWTWMDGSAITGKLLTTTAAPSPTEDIPWLSLEATPVPGKSGALSAIVLVRRTETHGGVAPVTGCDADHKGVVTKVPYTATYAFWTK